MAAGLAASYGTLAVEGLLFLLPPRIRPRTRKLFAGNLDQYSLGSVQTFLDLQGTEILVKRSDKGLKAFGSICPHLGCHVHWETEKQRFFCPCHNGIFDAEGVALSGPPAAAGQRLAEVSLEINEKSGVVYIEVKDVKRKRV
jgi:Rieske Fe-S protein